MKIIKLDNTIDYELILDYIGSTKAGNAIIADKMKTELFLLKDIKSVAANILKQDALSIGAELAVPKNTILLEDEYVDALLIANKKQLKILSKKEKLQPFGLKSFATELDEYIQTKRFPTTLMGVLNINEDSFYSGSRFTADSAKQKIVQMIDDGADIIDIGGVSSRPGSKSVSSKEELQRVKPIIDLISDESYHEMVDFSIDSYQPVVIEYALKRGFKIVNDIRGLRDDEVCKVVAKYSAKVVIMHMQGNPEDMQKSPTYENVILDVEEFFKNRIQKAESFGIKDITLDVGIGFGKTLEHNLLLIKHLSHFTHLGYPLLIGASRKSMIDQITPSVVEDRLAGTLVLHIKAVENGATVVRCHDVKEHKMAFSVLGALQKTIV
jgi:dihydropteroate synthase